MSARYARQQILPEVGDAGQARIRAAHALVIGAGGLGAPVLQYLAGAGLGRITLWDPDRVETGNLHRQVIFSAAHLGRFKAEAAAEVCAALNPDCTVTPVIGSIDPGTVEAALEGTDLVIDCADSFAASYTASDACLARGLPLFSGSVLGLSGYAGGFCAGAPSLRAVFPDLPERMASCATAGVLGPAVGVVGSLLAQLALSHVLGLSPSPLGRLVSWDGSALRLGGFRFDGAPEPARAPRFIAPAAIASGDFVVDLREAEEAPVPATPGALRLTVPDLGASGPLPGPGQRAVLCCRSGLRSWQAASRLAARWDGEIVLVALGEATPENT
ncbi:HesA/MoeB/ThiF family protein [Oceanicella sp. SM1341]|uniref:HesA/MoeB/ThiF family protein n=1 Tax=Oceanicella sp. SM1341 TaxID=1548889 RepID=UPI0018E529CF|nr:HesA/MoeB/ThiF family protein [Oceanicella sp. SM1341]